MGGSPVLRSWGPQGCSRPHNSSRQRAVELTRRSLQLAVGESIDSCRTDRTVDSKYDGIADPAKFYDAVRGMLQPTTQGFGNLGKME